MKHSKLLTWILTVMMAVTLFAFAACVDKPQVQELTELTLPTMAPDQMAIIVKNGDKNYTNVVVTLGAQGIDAQNVQEVLEYLDAQGILSVRWQDSDYGKFVTGIGNAVVTQDNQFISVLTSVSNDMGNWAGVTRYTVGGVELVSSQYGVSQMTVQAAAVIYFELATY